MMRLGQVPAVENAPLLGLVREIEATRVAVIDATLILRDLILEPKEYLMTFIFTEEPQVADWVGTNADELWQAASQTVNAMVEYPESQEPNQTALRLRMVPVNPYLMFCPKIHHEQDGLETL
ncbi:hypothetical protein DID88_009837 [Monilinia fructigena]|uniref:Uncharacterized protein n=1 Tax=Monilinia fructigena TaxID=38457 RepID=A0A395IKR3_9HELO|nr:hypothetical protein DID88_009837 [Monilinia fructigena]